MSQAKKKPKLPFYLSLLLVIALGISVAKLMWLVLTPAPNINANLNSQALSATAPTNSQSVTKNYGKIIANLHLFGEVKKEPVAVVKPPVSTEPKTPPPVELDLKLHGIVAYTDKKGYALISSNGKEQKVYGQGDKINDDDEVTITKLFPEKVVINNHGTEIELILPSNENKNAKANPTPSRSMNNNRSMPPPAAARRNSGKPARAGNNAPDLSSFRSQVLANPAKLMDVATPSPAYDPETDEFIGFRVQPGSNRQIFRQIGLRANDVITSVNGIALDSPQKGASVLGELAQASSITLEVKRGNQILTLSHSF